MTKVYYLEDMTQEELNKLALERNVLQSNWNSLKEWLEKHNITTVHGPCILFPKEVLDKMNELEGKDNNGIMD